MPVHTPANGTLPAMPRRHWSTREVRPDHALAYWVDTICDQFLELDIDSPLRNRFHACLDQVDLGPASANFFEAETQRVRRTTRRIARTQAPMFVLMQLRLGRVRLHQSGREVDVGPGECVLVDGNEPYDLDCPHLTRALALRLPADWLRGWIAQPERYAARVFNSGNWSAALCAAMSTLNVDSCDHFALPADEIAEPIATLLKLAIGPEPPVGSRQPVLLDKLMRTLKNRMHESDLSPAAVAGEHHVSARTLHYAFAGAGTTFTERLITLRLDRARDMLANANLCDLPVAEVAGRCGFADPSHFARRFRQRFGQSPLQFRTAALGPH